MRFTTPLILLAATTLCAQSIEFADSSRFSVEVGLGFGNLLGDITDKDGEYYRNVGFGVVDSKGNVSPIDPSGAAFVLDAGCYFQLAKSLAVGPAFKYQSVSEAPKMPMKDNSSEDLLSAKIAMAKIRWEPIQVQNLRFGLEGGIGMGFGTLHRYGLAVKHMDLIRSNLESQAAANNLTSTMIDNIVSYGTEGNRPLDLRGLHFELAARASALFRYGFGVFGTIGFERTNWSVTGNDPLDTRLTKYPSSVSGFGVELRLGLLKQF
jgi:hypothetical protein